MKTQTVASPRSLCVLCDLCGCFCRSNDRCRTKKMRQGRIPAIGSPACAVADQHPEPEVQGGRLPDFFRHVRLGTRTPKPLWSATRATTIGSKSIWPEQTPQGKLWTGQRRDARGVELDCGVARTAWLAPPSPDRWPSPCAGFYAWFPRCQSRRPSSTGTRA